MVASEGSDSDQFSRNEVTLVTIPEVVEYSPERLNYTIGCMLEDRFDVTLVGPEEMSERIDERFDTWTSISRRFLAPIQSLLMLPLTVFIVLQYAHKERPAVLASVGNLYVNGLACALIGRVLSIPSIVRVTSDLFRIYRFRDTRRGRIGTFVRNNILGRLTVHLADRVIVLGPVMKGKLEAKGIPRSNVVTIPQPLFFQVDGDRQESSPRPDLSGTEIRQQYGATAEKTLVLFVGYFSSVKGPERLTRTIRYVRERNDDMLFLIVGSGGHHESEVKASFSEDDGVKFTGWVNHKNLPSYYEAADILLQTSNSEGLPNVVLEALAHNTPVVATDSGGEVPVYVSNIGYDYRDLGELLCSPEEIIQDPLPRDIRQPRNQQMYLRLFSECAGEAILSTEEA